MTNKEHITYIEEWLKDEYSLNPKDREVLTAALKALEELPKRRKEIKRWKAKVLEQQSDTVPKSVYTQVARERDIAIEQLNELGYEFGEKIELSKIKIET